MNSISSSSGSYQTAMMQGMGGPRGRPKPEASDVAAQIFSKLDTDKQGYLEASDFTSAISQLSSSQQQASGEEVFSSLDSDSDGKLTQDELTTGIQALQDQLDSQFNAMRVQQGMGGMNGMGGMPPPPPPGGGRGGQGEDEGFDQDQLSQLASAAEEAGDSRGASMFSELADNFDEADADGDGKVTFSESVAYREQQQQASSEDDSSSDTGSSSASSSSTSLSQEMQNRIAQRLMDMMRAYDRPERDSDSSARFAA